MDRFHSIQRKVHIEVLLERILLGFQGCADQVPPVVVLLQKVRMHPDGAHVTFKWSIINIDHYLVRNHGKESSQESLSLKIVVGAERNDSTRYSLFPVEIAPSERTAVI